MAYEIKYRSDNEMKDSGIEWLGKVPKEWQVKKLKYLTNSVKNGIWGEEEKGDRHDIPCVRITNFNRYNNKVELNDLTIRNLNKYKQKEYLLSRNDLLIEKSGGGEYQPVGFVTLYTSDKPAIYANFMAKISINKKNSNLYLLYYFRNLYDRRINKKYINQTTGIQNIDVTSYFNEKVAIPYLNDQQKIANFLDIKTSEFDSIISKKEQLIEKLEEAKKSLISEVVTGKVKIVDGELVDRKPEEMKDSGVEWLGMIPKDWEVKMVKHIVNIFRGRFNHRPRNDIRLYENGTHPFIQTGDIAKSNKYLVSYSQTLNEKGARISATFPIDTLLMTIAANIGDLSIAKIKAYYPDSIVGFYPKSNINEEYLYLLFSSMKDEFLRTSIINTQANLNIERIGSINTTIPTGADEVVSITKYLNKEAKNLDSIITKTKQQITKLKEAKQSLISEAVTGKIDLRDWEIIETGGR